VERIHNRGRSEPQKSDLLGVQLKNRVRYTSSGLGDV
jgi:hypothetical protein